MLMFNKYVIQPEVLINRGFEDAAPLAIPTRHVVVVGREEQRS